MHPEIKTIAIADLKPAPYNPRKDLKPGDAEYDKIKASITAFGFLEPLVWNKRTGNVVGGHQRLKVLAEQGVKSVPCVVVDFDEDTEKAANLALNKIEGAWDFSKLADVLLELEHANFDLDLTGFDAGEVKNIMVWTPGIGETSTDRDGQNVASAWGQVEKSTNIPVRVGDIETYIAGDLYNRLTAALSEAYESDATPVPACFTEILARGMDARGDS